MTNRSGFIHIIFVEESTFSKHLDIWSNALAEQIEDDISNGKKVYIIALSRKMPRTFNWVKKFAATDSIKRLAQLLENPNVVLTTEYSLPFLSPQKDINAYSHLNRNSFYIVDDAIIFGATANRISMQTIALTGVIPKVSMVFRSKIGTLGLQFESERSLSMEKLDESDLLDAINGISDKIHYSSLPVDMEYPIIRIKQPYDVIKAYIEEHAPAEWTRYSVISEVSGRERTGFSIILGDETRNNYNNDFAKIRLFPLDTSNCCIEAIAPNAVGLEELEDTNYFINSNYATLWKFITNKINSSTEIDYSEGEGMRDVLKKFRQHANSLAKVVWCNYLLSLSAFCRNSKKLIPSIEKVRIENEDIKLLISDEISDSICVALNDILSNQIYSSSNHKRVALPKYINPKELTDEYLIEIASVISPNNTVEENLDAIFNVSHFSSPIFRYIASRDIIGHHCFGETYESLKFHLSLYHYDDSDLDMKINRWIDQKINECRISPKYEIIIGSDSKAYYRRFFLTGSNKI